MWLFILATYYCQGLYFAQREQFGSTYYYACSLYTMSGVLWYTYFYSCYDHIQDNTYAIFDYCECHVPKEGEEPFF